MRLVVEEPQSHYDLSKCMLWQYWAFLQCTLFTCVKDVKVYVEQSIQLCSLHLAVVCLSQSLFMITDARLALSAFRDVLWVGTVICSALHSDLKCTIYKFLSMEKTSQRDSGCRTNSRSLRTRPPGYHKPLEFFSSFLATGLIDPFRWTSNKWCCCEFTFLSSCWLCSGENQEAV